MEELQNYPRETMFALDGASAKIHYLVDVDGQVTQCLIAESSGKELFDKVACDTAMKRWKFRPALKDGTPIQVWRDGQLSLRLR